MRRGRLSRLTALCGALVIGLTGCRTVTGGGSDAGPPAGGWPQPRGDRVTTSMCGLLTDADYRGLGHDRRASLSNSVNTQDNTLDCHYRSGDELTLTLEPTADFAHYVFTAGLTDHKTRLARGHRGSGLVDGVIGVADESWFDLWTLGTAGARPVAHELRLRRGSLILGITLGGTRGRTEKDPRTVLTTLASLVLRRLPEAGLKDTGTQHKIQYAVVGTGRARSIQWRDYTDLQNGGEASNTRIPWLQTVPMATSDDAGVTPDRPFVRVEAGSPNAKVGCLIVVDDVPVAMVKPKKGFADCEGRLPESDAGGGTPPSAQPAAFE